MLSGWICPALWCCLCCFCKDRDWHFVSAMKIRNECLVYDRWYNKYISDRKTMHFISFSCECFPPPAYIHVKAMCNMSKFTLGVRHGATLLLVNWFCVWFICSVLWDIKLGPIAIKRLYSACFFFSLSSVKVLKNYPFAINSSEHQQISTNLYLFFFFNKYMYYYIQEWGSRLRKV